MLFRSRIDQVATNNYGLSWSGATDVSLYLGSNAIVLTNQNYGSYVNSFPAGTLMLFQQTSAPTGWTKQTTHNDKALRVVSGTASSGGTTAFTSVFTSRTPSGTVNMSNAAVTLSSAQMPSHSHSTDTTLRYDGGSYNWGGGYKSAGSRSSGTGGAGSGGSHTHANTASFSGSSMDFAVQYVDLIIASKN